MYRIGEFSKLTKTTVKTLRYYDEAGLLKPAEVDRWSGYRYYSTAQLYTLHRIQSFRQIGLSIEEISKILSGSAPEDFLLDRQKQLLGELLNTQDQLSRIAFILSGKEEESSMSYQSVIKEVPAHIVYSKRLVVPDYNAYFEVIPQIGKAVTEKYPELKCAVPEYCFIVYLDGEYKERDISIEFCEAVDKLMPDFDDIRFKTVPAVKVVSVMHKGAYSALSRAYAYAFKWIEENGFTVADCPRENYIDGIWNKESDQDWLTELQVPVQRNAH